MHTQLRQPTPPPPFPPPSSSQAAAFCSTCVHAPAFVVAVVQCRFAYFNSGINDTIDSSPCPGDAVSGPATGAVGSRMLRGALRKGEPDKHYHYRPPRMTSRTVRCLPSLMGHDP